MLHGFLNIAKPIGLTSHDVVARVRRAAGQKRVGHAGTLDPAANGVLPVALGQATRLVEYVSDGRKGYRAVVQLGVTTATDDAEGAVVARAPVPSLEAAAIEAALAPLRGTIMQVPPAYSALHVAGRRAYELARAGQAPELPARPVTVERLTLLDYAASQLVLDVVCGKGTYIRSIARDVGLALGCGAHLAQLTRTFVGPFALDAAVALDDLTPATIADHVQPPLTALASWQMVVVDAGAAQALRNGQSIRADDGGALQAYARDASGLLVALLQRSEARWKPAKVFTWD
jgi:tRNA pseudouridine55 synthase